MNKLTEQREKILSARCSAEAMVGGAAYKLGIQL